MELNFDDAFAALTGNPPFPWQRALYERFLEDRPDNIPASCNLPTGLGKTSVIAIWLLALVNDPNKMPRRLVYVVNRRTVVDQTTNEVRKLRANLTKVPAIATELLKLCGILPTEEEKKKAKEEFRPLAISTLRGQFADNREWSTDPSRPAVICGTVDMIGSRLLFSGYGIGKVRPLHAGFLGQDALLVHDEAHLEPAFQDLLVAMQNEQLRCRDFRPFRVMELSATSRGNVKPFELTDEEKSIPDKIPEPPTEPIHHVWRRLRSMKRLKFHGVKRDEVAKKIGEMARDHWKSSGKAVLVFVRTIEDVRTVEQVLTDKRLGVPADQVQLLTGTMRGLERDRMANPRAENGCRVFARFLPKPKDDAPEDEKWKTVPKEGAVFLICTSAGEVGVDISADHMVCDLTTLDSMAQRLGRVNRRGDGEAEVDVMYENDPDPKKKDEPFEKARWETKNILERLPICTGHTDRRETAPMYLRDLQVTDDERKAAFAPPPIILPVSDILFDAWALTSIRGKLPGRPQVEPYLHGISGWQPPETYVAWREEVELITGELLEQYPPSELLDDYALKPHELLREPSYRAFKHFEAIAKRRPEDPVWLLDDDGTVTTMKLFELADKDEKDRINGKTVILPPSAGGLGDQGMLNGGSERNTGLDVADNAQRCRVFGDNDELTDELKKTLEPMHWIRRIDFPAPGGNEDTDGTVWHWFEIANEGGQSSAKPVTWKVHTDDVVRNATAIVANLPLDQKLKDAIILAAQCHDLGKKRKLFQTILGNADYPNRILAKSGKKGGRLAEKYRHEFGSLLDVQREPEFQKLPDDLKDFVLHLIAVHHGRGRPHFPADEAFDPESKGHAAAEVARAVPQRFARLQRKYGRWGLAYLESLLRAADYAASAKPSAYEEGQS